LRDAEWFWLCHCLPYGRIVVAAVGPIVAAELDALGVQVNVTPPYNTFFMKPLVRELAAASAKDHKG